MNSLTLGFFYLVGLGWLMGETCLMAGNGSWGPLWLFLAGFALLFALIGCLPLSDHAVNKIGAISAIIVGLALLVICVLGHDGALLNTLKSICAAAYLIFGIVSLLSSFGKKRAESTH